MAPSSALLLAVLPVLSQARHTSSVWVPPSPPSRVLLPDVVGYSMEPVWVHDYIQTNITTNLLSEIAAVIGKAPPIRVGGTSSDQTYLHLDQNFTSQSYPNATKLTTFNISTAWYDTWANYFPNGTDIIYTLNFVDNSSAWATALLQAETIHNAFGDKLKLFELGNEIDHFIKKGWRPLDWDIAEYIDQWHNITDQIIASDWYQQADSPPKFQAAVFADPPWVPDQQDEIDDFDILNLTRSGLIEPDLIDSYAVHLYPQSTCDSERWHRMRLDLLSNHSVLWQNVSQYVPQVAAADAAQSPLVLGETNSVSCSGKSGISDTFGAALWTVDYVLMAASIGIQKLYFHLGAQSEYSAFTPIPYTLKNESLSAGIRSNFYAHYFLSHVVASNTSLSVAALPSANSSDLSGYGIYSGDGLQKLVFLDMGVWNGTQGLSNPSTLSATDGTVFSNGTRPVSQMKVETPWVAGAEINITRLNGPGTNAKSQVNVSGVTFNPESGSSVGTWESEVITVKRRGIVSFDLEQAQGVLLELVGSKN